eukprot:TRINITY_DN33999_c0_g1_i1.p1 TRINITY_DN33999_c0_g1~~TRINITY_DN33999_c0_g1_i1.p1  ORF type:complete len:260 (+),score=10.09 TRINITY_DN33999_c0_g1_i1:22-780(+)
MNILKTLQGAVRSVVQGQRRARALQPLKWPNERIMRKGLKNVCRPWEIRNDPDEIKGHFGLVAMRGGHITERQLENCMLTFKNRFRMKEYDITVRDNVQVFPQSRRPQGARLGKGIGDNTQWSLRTRAGTVIFDVKANHDQFINDFFVKRFFAPIQDMLGVPTIAVRGAGHVNFLDDINYSTAQCFLDRNFLRRTQDVYPDIQHMKAYDHVASSVPDSPVWNPNKPTKEWYPVYTGTDWSHRRAHWVSFHGR